MYLYAHKISSICDLTVSILANRFLPTFNDTIDMLFGRYRYLNNVLSIYRLYRRLNTSKNIHTYYKQINSCNIRAATAKLDIFAK